MCLDQNTTFNIYVQTIIIKNINIFRLHCNTNEYYNIVNQKKKIIIIILIKKEIIFFFKFYLNFQKFKILFKLKQIIIIRYYYFIVILI